MPKDVTPGKPATRRYSPEEKAAAVRMVRTLRAELGTEQGTIQRVARQLGYGTESVRLWVKQPTSTTAPRRVSGLEERRAYVTRRPEPLCVVPLH